MKLIFLGSGSAFTVGSNNFHSNILLVDEFNNNFLIDCGSDIRFSLHKAGYSYVDITDTYISHLHCDHAGGLEYIGLSTLFDNRCNKPNLYLSKDIAATLWSNFLSGGMGIIEGDLADIDTFFRIKSIDFEQSFLWQQIKFDLVKVIHVDGKYLVMPSYGLFFKIGENQIFITTDTKFCFNLLEKYYDQATIIFQDCEISINKTPVHAHYNELVTLPDHIKNKMWLYGYQPDPLPPAKKDGFQGFVECGQIFEL